MESENHFVMDHNGGEGKAPVYEFGDKELKDGEPCHHRGCLSHITHPCEGCGRIAGGRLVHIELYNKMEQERSALKARCEELEQEVAMHKESFSGAISVVENCAEARDALLTRCEKLEEAVKVMRHELIRLVDVTATDDGMSIEKALSTVEALGIDKGVGK